jgi:hypothetical protein
LLDTKWGHIVSVIIFGSCFVWGYIEAVSYAPMKHTLIAHLLGAAIWSLLVGLLIWGTLFFFCDVLYKLITEKSDD